MAVWSYMPQDVLTETVAVPTRATETAPGASVVGVLSRTITREIRTRYTLVDTVTANSMAAFYTAQRGAFAAFQLFHHNDTRLHTVRFASEMALELFAPGWLRTNDLIFVTVGS